jgi:hypothetical protein
MERILGGSIFVGTMPSIQGAETFCFRQGSREIVVARALGEPFSARIAARTSVAEIDLWGNGRVHVPQDGFISVPLSEEFRFLTGLSLGYSETVQSLTVEEAHRMGAGGTIRLAVENFIGQPVRLVIRETASGAVVETVLAPAGTTRVNLPVDADTARRLRKERKATFSASLLLDNEEKYREERELGVFWGKRRFKLADGILQGGTFTFSLVYLGENAVRGHVFLAEEADEGPEILRNWSNLSFPPGRRLTFEGGLPRPIANPRAIVLAEGGGEPEVFPLGVPVGGD